jgi:hypothetical protein
MPVQEVPVHHTTDAGEAILTEGFGTDPSGKTSVRSSDSTTDFRHSDYDPAEFQGIHARYVLVIIDEAGADRFSTETLGPILAMALGPEPVGRPEVIGIDVAGRTWPS